MSASLLYGHDDGEHSATKIICELSFGSKEEEYQLEDLPGENIRGLWTSTTELAEQHKQATFSDIVVSKKALYLLESKPLDLARACYRQFAASHHPRSLYFTQVKSIKAYKADDPKCNGHQIITAQDAHRYRAVYAVSSDMIKNRLEKYNFAVVLEGLVYRSKALGVNGIKKISEELAQANLPGLQSIASIHVMGYGGAGGDYNLQELAETKKRGMTFLHTYAYERKLVVYMDGTDPSKIIETDPDHGNVYEEKTLLKFIPDAEVRKDLGIDRSLAEKRQLSGNTMDFLQSLENIIDAPWPILIHCKGGRHKTGMFALILEFLAFNEAMAEDLVSPISVPLYKNRFARWLDRKGSFFEVFFGGPWFANFDLHPAEVKYFEHNKSVFREKNIEFVRGLIKGSKLDSELLQKKWQEIQNKFHAKIKMLAPFAIGQY